MKLIALAFLVGCTGSNKSPPEQTAPEPAPVAEPAPEPVDEPVPADATDGPAPQDPAPTQPNPDPDGRYGASYRVVDGPMLTGTTLTLIAAHGGGCEEHVFTPRLDPRSADAPSTQVVHLHHEDNGDRCRGLLRTELKLDLADLLEDCTEAVELHAWPVDGDHTWSLPVEPAYACD